jgi:hypothetical protein
MIFETVALPSVGTLSKLANTCSISTGMDDILLHYDLQDPLV